MTEPPPGAIVAVVDDDSRIRRSLECLLESADHDVLAFGSAPPMLESGCLSKIDCLISDIDMPGMDGFDLSQAVRDARPELPIILITGHPELLDRLPPMDASRHVVFRKPFDGHDLLTAVDDAVRNLRMKASPPRDDGK